MTSTPAVKLEEACSCGATVSVEGTSWDAMREHVQAWRREHLHVEPRSVESVGFAATSVSRSPARPSAIG